MKKSLITASTLLIVSFGAQAEGDLSAKLSKLSECRDVSSVVSTAIDAVGGVKATVQKVTPIVSESLEAKPSCACEVTTAAIVSTGANDKSKSSMLEAIVETAFTTLPDKTSDIAECAVAAAPNHSALIEKTLRKVFSDAENKYQGGSSSKATSYSSKGYSKGESYGKPGPIDTPVREKPIAPAPAPIYLIAPGTGGYVPVPVSPGERQEYDYEL